MKEAIAHRGSSMRNYRDGAGKKGQFNERLAVYARRGNALSLLPETHPAHCSGRQEHILLWALPKIMKLHVILSAAKDI